jgi:predicted adenine nucleotide alpha hydrolase (AANH) superfamily ATPase
MRTLLHACCGPCLLEPLDALSADHDVIVAYANPNIHPLGEYRRRRDTLASYAEGRVEVLEVTYEPGLWLREVGLLADEPERRCAACYRLRLTMTAELAAEHGFDAIATTLTVSPYQDQQAIRDAGEAATAGSSIEYIDTDFRDRYRRAVDRSRELGMYRQRYCGCLASELEAEESRASKKRR